MEDDDALVEVDIDRGRVLRRITLPGAPHNITVGSDGTVAATLWRSGAVALVREGKERIVELGGAPHDVKVAGGLFVVANQTAARLDLLTRKGLTRGSIPLSDDPHDVAIAPGGVRAWATLEGNDDLAVVDVPRRDVSRYVSTARRPHDLLFAPDGRLWITDWEGALHLFSASGALVNSIPLGVEAHHLDFLPGGRQAWITDHRSKAIFVISARDLTVTARIPMMGSPHHVTISPDGKRAIVADHDRGSLLVFDTSSYRLLDEIAVGDGPHGVWAVPSASMSP